MERSPDDIFRVHDLSVLKSPMPAHLMATSIRKAPVMAALNNSTTSTFPPSHIIPVRPTPKQNSSPFGLSALAANMNNSKVSNPTIPTSSLGPSQLVGGGGGGGGTTTPSPRWRPLGDSAPLQPGEILSQSPPPPMRASIKNNPQKIPSTPPPPKASSYSSPLPTIAQVLSETSIRMATSSSMEPTESSTIIPPPTIASNFFKVPTYGPSQTTTTTKSRTNKEYKSDLKDTLHDDELNNVKERRARKDIRESNSAQLLDLSYKVNTDEAPEISQETVKGEEKVVESTNVTMSSQLTTTSKKVDEAIILSNWSMLIVPNNPSVTRIDKNITEYWIILIGRRSDMSDMWHSSLISNRLSKREVTTGSGRVYRLEGPIDESALAQVGFRPHILEAFREGFPENWRKLLLQELTSIKTQANDEYQLEDEKSTIQKGGNDDEDDITAPTTAAAVKDQSKPRYSELSKKEVAIITNTPKSKTDDDYSGSSRNRRKSEPVSRWRDAIPYLPTDLPIVGQTRSGRKVIKPLPYWENKYLRADSSSPTSNAALKRSWGDRLEIT